MSDPKKLLQSSAEPLERQLLESLRQGEPSAELREAIWAGASSKLALRAAAATTVKASAKLKALLLTSVAAGSVVAAISWLTMSPTSVRSLSAPATTSRQLLRRDAQAPTEAPSSSGNAESVAKAPSAEAASTRSGHVARPGSNARRLQAEAQAVRDARARLLSGDSASALNLLRALDRDVPGGALTQERERLTIEALLRSGAHAEARTRARAFARRYPGSPHTEQLTRLGLLP